MPATTRLASTSKPVAAQAVNYPPERARNRMTAAASSRAARSANAAKSARWAAMEFWTQPHAPLGYLSHRCRYSR